MKWVGLIALAGVAALVAVEFPELRRYMKIERM
jgi:hypothetical protein